MTREITAALGRWLGEGFTQIGQIEIATLPGSGYALAHVEDSGRPDLQPYTNPQDARHLATLDDAGAFRPLRTAPNLRHGWRLLVQDLEELRTALDHFYPAMLGVLVSHGGGTLPVIPLRDLLARQSGMYAITRKITDEQAQELIGGFCKSQGGCLKTILWPIAPGQPVTSLPSEKFDLRVNQTGGEKRAIPMLCHEGCNLLVAAARGVVKRS